METSRTFNELHKSNSIRVYAKTATRAIYFYSCRQQTDQFGVVREMLQFKAANTSIDDLQLDHPLIQALMDTFTHSFFVMEQSDDLNLFLASLAIRPDLATLLPEHLRPLLAHLIFALRLVATVRLHQQKIVRQARAAPATTESNEPVDR
jgi:hypothetical protein